MWINICRPCRPFYPTDSWCFVDNFLGFCVRIPSSWHHWNHWEKNAFHEIMTSNPSRIPSHFSTAVPHLLWLIVKLQKCIMHHLGMITKLTVDVGNVGHGSSCKMACPCTQMDSNLAESWVPTLHIHNPTVAWAPDKSWHALPRAESTRCEFLTYKPMFRCFTMSKYV